MQCHQIDKYMIKSKDPKHLALYCRGSIDFRDHLQQIFPEINFDDLFWPRDESFYWGVNIEACSRDMQLALDQLLSSLIGLVYISHCCDGTFAMGWHKVQTASGDFVHTRLGKLVYDAKSYDCDHHPGDRTKAAELARLMCDFVRSYPLYRQADGLVATPGSNQNKNFDLPSFLVEEISRVTDLPVLNAIKKTKSTKPVKQCASALEKEMNLRDVYSVEKKIVSGKTIIVVDDICQSGVTINLVSQALRAAGASTILGLVATKTISTN